MRKVVDTERNPEWVLSATAHSTEWISTNTRLPLPNPNQISASGNSAMAGKGLNMEVSVSRKSVPMRELIASSFSATPKALSRTGEAWRSGRCTMSSMGRLLALHGIAEEHVMDLVLQLREALRVVVGGECVQLRFHLPRMRREQQHAIADF